MVSGNIFEGLLRYSPKLEPLPGLAESWNVSEDAKVYTFKLKPGVTWHDGKPFTSADVLFSIEMLKQTHARARGNLVQLEKVEAPDDLTVVFTLKQPFGPFLGIFEVGSLPMVPKHLYEGTDFKTNANNNAPIGTGPFMFKEWQKGSFIRLVKNPSYHDHGQALSRRNLLADHSGRRGALGRIRDRQGRCAARRLGRELRRSAPSASSRKPALPARAGNSSARWPGCGSTIAPAPPSNKKIRQAIMHAVDRNFAKDVIWNGLGKVATGPSASTIKFYTDDVPKYPFDPAKAKALLKEAGYNGEKVRLMPLALWRNLAALGRGREAEPAGRRHEHRDHCHRRARLEPEDRRLGLRYFLHLSLSVWRSGAGRRPQLRLQPDHQGPAVQQRRGLFESGDRPSCSPRARSLRRTPNARNCTRKRRRSWSKTCRWHGCWSCSFRPSPAARSRTSSRQPSASTTASAMRGSTEVALRAALHRSLTAVRGA